MCNNQSQKARAAPISAPKTSILHQTVSRLPVANHVFLDGWHLPGGSQPEVSSSEETHSTPEIVSQHTQEAERAGPATWLRCTVPLGQCARQAPGHLSCLDQGRAQNTCSTESVPLRHTREPHPSSLDLGSAKNPGPALDSALQNTLQPEQCRPRKHTLLWAGANPVWSIYCEHFPHTPAIFVCGVPPSPHHNWTSEPK